MQVFGTHDDATRAQLARVAEHARKVALMADGHVGYAVSYTHLTLPTIYSV